jgi:hypothetical protein
VHPVISDVACDHEIDVWDVQKGSVLGIGVAGIDRD